METMEIELSTKELAKKAQALSEIFGGKVEWGMYGACYVTVSHFGARELRQAIYHGYGLPEIDKWAERGTDKDFFMVLTYPVVPVQPAKKVAKPQFKYCQILGAPILNL